MRGLIDLTFGVELKTRTHMLCRWISKHLFVPSLQHRISCNIIVNFMALFQDIFKVFVRYLCVYFLNRLLRRRSRKTSQLPSQKAGNAKNTSIWWRHHVCTSEIGRVDLICNYAVDTHANLYWLVNSEYQFRAFGISRNLARASLPIYKLFIS